MTKIFNSKLLSLGLILVLIATMALTFTACKDEKTPYSTIVLKDGETIGKGETSFSLEIVNKKGEKITAVVNTNETTIGKALLDLNIIAGENADYGLYIKSVGGTTLDFEKDGYYWAFYIDGEYALSGVDTTEIEPNKVYTLKAEKS